MKILFHNLLIVFLLFSFGCFSQKDTISNGKEKFLVEICITQTSSYCGGVKPDPETITELKRPKPLANKILFIKKGEQNTFDSKILLEIISDSSGKVNIHLPPGKYFVVDELKKDTSFYNKLIKEYEKESTKCSAINKDCLKNWYVQPDFIFEIKEEPNKFVVNFHKGCSWNEVPYNCCKYKGPYPP
jgi:hypothetical protein